MIDIDKIKDNIMMIEFTEYGCMEMVALFNTTKTTEQEAREEIEMYRVEMQTKTIIIRKKQFDNVFK